MFHETNRSTITVGDTHIVTFDTNNICKVPTEMSKYMHIDEICSLACKALAIKWLVSYDAIQSLE